MADGQRRGGRPEEGTPEYEWLYGSSGSAPRPDQTQPTRRRPRPGPDDESTRLLPGGGAPGAAAAGAGAQQGPTDADLYPAGRPSRRSTS
ncbi:hypothetical protein KK617_05710, partial [Nocardioides sp. ChNu-99]|nr:hypothetical protein [Nocardioides sp. ChNu-99]